MNIIKVENLVKKYGDFTAVNDISFSVDEGTLFAFLGPNGSGKTTTISILSTIIKQTSGNVLIYNYNLGKDDEKIRDVIGVVYQDSVLDKLLTVKENLIYRAGLYGFKKKYVEEYIEFVSKYIEIKSILGKKYGTLSGGQRRKVDIIRALIQKPKILFLDEPTTGLDPKSRKDIWCFINKIRKDLNTTIFLTTHYLEEAENADKIVIISEGNIIASGTPFDIKAQYSTSKLRIEAYDFEEFKNVIKNEYKVNGQIFVFNIKNKDEAISLIKKYEKYIKDFELIKPNLDDVFINITGKDGIENDLSD